MPTLEIPGQEQGTVRVFAVSQPIAQMARRLKQHDKAAVASELLRHRVSDEHIELFPISDLAGMGLPSYLIEGYAIPPDRLKPDRGRLEALDGYVLLLHSSVARDDTVTLSPGPDLTLIGTYAEPARSRAAAPIQTQAAKPYTATTTIPERRVKSRLGSLLGLVMLALVVVVLWLVAT